MTAMTTHGLPTSNYWPDVVRVPHAPLRARVARGLLDRALRDIAVQVRLPDGSIHGCAHPQAPVMEVVSSAFFHRLGADLKIGLGESYMAGEWRAGPGSDLADVLTPFAERLTDLVPAGLARFRRLVEPRQPRAEDNDRRGARANISRHYDLSNDLFASFLDETMTYSSARFDEATRAAGFSGLAAAQHAKVEAILDLARVGPGSRMLEIGTGWGQLALQAGQRGASVRSVTLSTEQATLARQRIAGAGLSDRVHVDLCDYRDIDGRFDAVVSVEMVEAVGERYWPTFFASVGRVLAPGGWFGMQAITMSHERMLASRHAYGWVHKYVFPGGLIPSVEAIEANAAPAGLRLVEQQSLQADYALTLRLWRQRFLAEHEHVLALGFDDTFVRMWELYLAYSEAGFRSRHLDVRQLALRREA